MTNATKKPVRRVAMVGYTFYESDARLKMYVEYLVNSGYHVDVIALEDPHCAPPQNTEHVSFYRPRQRKFERQGMVEYIVDYVSFTLACAVILLKHHLAGRRYDVVHVNNMPNFLLFAALPIRLLGARTILDVHDTMPEILEVRSRSKRLKWYVACLKFEEWLCLKLADVVITSEHTKRERLVENGLDRRKSTVLLNLADPGLFPERSVPQTAHSSGGPFRIVFHGTLTWRLGVDTAIRAIALARKHIPLIRFEITGDGEQRAELMELAKELGVDSLVQFSDGFVPVEALAGRLAGADLGVMASRVNKATDLMLPVKLLEYVQMGIPCIVVPTKSITHYFAEPSVKFVPPDDPASLADAIVNLFRHPEKRHDMARTARAFYKTYNFGRQRETYMQIIADLAAHKTPTLEHE